VDRKNIYEQDSGFVGYLFPGIIAIGIMFISLNVASIGVIRERLLGSLDRILSAPSPLWLFLISKYLAYTVLASVSGILVLIAGNVLFNISISGSVWLVILLEVFTALPFIGLALAASIMGKSEFESHAIANFIAIPLMFISGVFFPIQCMPIYIKKVAEILPLTYSVSALRDVIIKGGGYFDIINALIALLLYGLLFFLLVIFIFRKRKK
jgi:ABC-2 type transport system permease protein